MSGKVAIGQDPSVRYAARVADGADDMALVLALRGRVFRSGAGSDEDRFDPLCRHFIITEQGGRAPVCVFRVLVLRDGSEIGQSYAAQSYDLCRLALYQGAMLELGRFCIDPVHTDPDILRFAWGLIAAEVDRNAVALLFGCSSFRGADPALHHTGLGHLNRFVAPDKWAPLRKDSRSVGFPPQSAGSAARDLPPLLRSYLQMGGWVSDHAVIDTDLDTLHVFTGVEIAAIPPARARLLRLIAAQIV